MPMKNSILTLVLLFASVSFMSAQTKVSGMVVDNTDMPIPYANVVFKGSKIGVVWSLFELVLSEIFGLELLPSEKFIIKTSVPEYGLYDGK